MTARGWSPADLSRASGVDQSVIGRWRDKGATPSPDNVRKVARGLARDVLEAAVAAGHYTADELARPGVRPVDLDLSAVSHEDLRDEVYARMVRSTTRPRRRRQAADPIPDAAGASSSPDSRDVTDVPAGGDQDVTTVHRGRLGESVADERTRSH